MNYTKPLLLATLVLLLVSNGIGCGSEPDDGSVGEQQQKTEKPENPGVNDDPGPTDTTPNRPSAPKERPECKPEVIAESKVTGRLWLDDQRVGKTEIEQGVDPTSPAIEGIPDQQISLVLPGGKRLETTTCPNGWFSFQGVTEDMGILDFHRNDCTTNNCPTNTARFAQKRKVKIVTFGDSIPSYPKKGGDGLPIWFPQKLQELVAPVVEIENVNVAIPGTTTTDWMPGSKNFEERIKENADADVFLFSLGGNNVLYRFFKSALIPGIILKNIDSDVEQAVVEGKTILEKIREIAPQADIVFTSYLNYSRTFKSLNIMLPAYKRPLVRAALKAALKRHISEFAGYQGAMAVDIFGYTEIPLADGSLHRNEDFLIWDGIHLNDTGHEFFARRVFNTLGGWIENDHIGKRHYVGYPSK